MMSTPASLLPTPPPARRFPPPFPAPRSASSPKVAAVISGRLQAFRAISLLRKLCNHADLASPPDKNELKFDDDDDDENDAADANAPFEGFGATERSGKLLILEQILPKWYEQGHRVLLFSQVQPVSVFCFSVF